MARDKANLDITWLRDETLPAPGVLAAGIVEDLWAVLAQFQEIADDRGISGDLDMEGAEDRVVLP